MAGNYFEINACKDLLNIDVDDSVEDELLNRFGRVANTHIDNILKAHDERIPLKVPNVMADIKMTANYYVCSLFRGKRGDVDSAKFWMEQSVATINGLIMNLEIDGSPQVVERFTGRRFHGDSHYLADW
tara:strand:+ start:7175 stop:7561 length:387 start_codon:yes stop_codon:yes gene_type:complete